MVWEIETTDLHGTILASSRTDRAGTGPGGSDPIPILNFANTEVVKELNQLRTAQTEISVHSPDIFQPAPASTLWFDGPPDVAGTRHRVGALGRMLRVYLRGHLVFWDTIDNPGWNAKTGRVVIRAKQRTRLLRAFARYGDGVVGPSGGPAPQNPNDYRTIRALVAAAENADDQNAYPPLGIMIAGTQLAPDVPWVITVTATGGTFTLSWNGHTTGAIAYNASASDLHDALVALPGIGAFEVDVEKPDAGVWGITFVAGLAGTTLPVTADGSSLTGGTVTVSHDEKQISRGANIYDEITAIQESRYGPDWELEPREDLGNWGEDDDGNPWPFYCRLNTYERQGQVRNTSFANVFRYALPPLSAQLPNNLDDFDWDPSGDPVRNYVVAVTQGQAPAGGKRAIARDTSSWREIGMYEDWLAPEGGNAGDVSQAALENLGEDHVHAYGRPPNFLTLKLLTERAGVPQWLTDYDTGDQIGAVLSKGAANYAGSARITKVTARQPDQAGNVKCELEVVPDVSNLAAVESFADA